MRPELARKLLRKLFRSFSQSIECASGEPEYFPVVQRYRSKLVIEVNCGFIPIQYRPLEAVCAALLHQVCEIDQERLSDASAAVGRLDKQIFQINPGTPDESREVLEINGKCGRLVIHVGKDDLCRSLFTEEIFPQRAFISDNPIEQLFIFGQLPNEAQDERNILFFGLCDS